MRSTILAAAVATLGLLAFAGAAGAEARFKLGPAAAGGATGTRLLDTATDRTVQVCNDSAMTVKLTGLRQAATGEFCPEPAQSVFVRIRATNCIIVQACSLFIDYENAEDVGKDLSGTFGLIVPDK